MSGKQTDPEATDGAGVRKRLLQGLGGAAGIAGLAGCLGGVDDDEEMDDEEMDDEEMDDEEVDDEEVDDEEVDDEEVDEDLEDQWLRDPEEHGWEPDAEAATDWDNYELTQLGPDIDNLMAIDVDHEGRVWYIERGGLFPTYGDDECEVGWVDADGNHEVVLELPVTLGSIPEDWGVEDWGDLETDEEGNDDDNDDNDENDEEEEAEPPEPAERELGGQGVAVDPDGEYLYICYHPSSEEDDLFQDWLEGEYENPYHEDISTGGMRVSRFEFDTEEIDPDTEEVILTIPYNRTTCCHHGGDLEFGPEGHLWITTGDDSNNVGNPNRPEIDFFTGDERDVIEAGRPALVGDAQRSAGNTADLRGSTLRITPTDDGDYEVPEGNLKHVYEEQVDEEFDEEEFRPEIYVMGFRNPYIVEIDDHTGFLFVADYGNDATESDPDHGPVGMATYSLWDRPGNAGWPYCKGMYPTRYYDFEEEEPGQPFWPDNLRNRSPNNTGIENIPNFTPHLAWQPQSWNAYVDIQDIPWLDMPRPGELTWPELPEGGSANAGPAYRYDDDFGEGALDPYFESKQFFMTPFAGGGQVFYFTYHEDGSVEINEFLEEDATGIPSDMGVLPDGRVVIMSYGEGFDGENGRIHLVEYEE